ncbi:hypothetical protein SpCBS45565_g07525 [Spizellomyces sp. 'palustris']|nr:hypothetical protein SpCBS45565_g07525 [Spizellomyces sp. 'palustris']
MGEVYHKMPAFARLSERVRSRPEPRQVSLRKVPWNFYIELKNYVIIAKGKFTLQGTNTYLVGTGHRRILIDTGSGVADFEEHLRTSLTRAGGIGISSIICTHRHRDHISGIPQVLALNGGADHIPIYKYLTAKDTPPFPYEYTAIRDGHTFKTEGATLRAVHTPGHLDDHVVLYLEEENAVFSGDCVLGQGTAVFENLAEYMSSLRRILELQPGRLYPGHGPVIENGVQKIEEYIRHRQEREEQIVALLNTDPPYSKDGKNAAWSSRQLVETIYASYPKSLYDAAEGSLLHHLNKLLSEGKVQHIEDRWLLTTDKKLPST